MSALTNPSTSNTHEAQFLAPETPQQAGARTKGKGGGPQEAKKLGADTVQPGDMVLIPVSRLVRSPFNVRRTGGEDVTELAALIKAQGVLQNLVVHDDMTKRGALTGDYGVAAGGRRMKALHALVKAGDLSHDHEVLCKYITRAEALASSMAENSGREPMTVPDTVTAFADMVASGAGIEDLAVFFGITPLTVQRRMKLAKVSPKLFELFRQDQINLDQLMALAITDDHAAQERVWKATPDYNRSASTLRRLLLGREIDAATDPLAKFVGLAAYEAAGGVVVRDLFEDEGGGYITDAELLQRLAVDKLAQVAEGLKREGWAWTEARTSFDHSERHAFGVAAMGKREPSPKQRESIGTLTTAQDEANTALEALYEGDEDDFDQDKASELETQIERLDAKLDKIDRALSVWTPEILAFAGVVVAIDRNGEPVVHRGLVKPEDRKQAAKAAAARTGGAAGVGDADETPEAAATPESLVRKLTAHKTKALQLLLADNTHVALAALAHAMVQQIVDERMGPTESALSVRGQGCDHHLKGVADDMEASKAWGELGSRVDQWRERIPGDAAKLLPWLIEQPQATLLELLALCAALSVNAVAARETEHSADALAAAVGLDMADWWAPTAASYLAQVPKARIIDAVTEAVSAERAAPLAKLKKAEAVAAAEALLQGTRWLPAALRARKA